jgi:hypothetical protein
LTIGTNFDRSITLSASRQRLARRTCEKTRPTFGVEHSNDAARMIAKFGYEFR